MIDPATVAARFGYGLRADRSDGVGPFARQFERFEARPVAFASAPTRAVVAASLSDYLEETREARLASRGTIPARQPAAADMPAADPALRVALQATRRYARDAARGQYLALVGARMAAALDTPSPFLERMVHFWANHFAISVEKLQVLGLGGLLEVEAVRPNVLGRFVDMLLAVERHPAMLLYLDQAQSVGPDSRIGQAAAARAQRRIGLNENLAREIMELHTLGVRSGYSQADVTELARALTGWTTGGITRGPMARALSAAGPPGQFVFAPALHQPGERIVMGRRYAAGGEAQAEAILRDLAVQPATALYIATKLARHFAGDAPPPALIDRLAARFQTTGGDLPALYRTLIEAPELQSAALTNFKTPWDWAVSALRAMGVRQVEGQAIAGLLTQLGQPVWRPGSPAGFDDADASWAAPDGVLRRVEAAARLATRSGGADVDPRRLAANVLPGGGSATTLAAIARAESPAEGIALMLVAPEMMRR